MVILTIILQALTSFGTLLTVNCGARKIGTTISEIVARKIGTIMTEIVNTSLGV